MKKCIFQKEFQKWIVRYAQMILNYFNLLLGSLNVYIKRQSQLFSELHPVWNRSGDGGNEWKKASILISLMEESFQIVIEGVRGSSYNGDIAIDDLDLEPSNKCLLFPSSASITTSTTQLNLATLKPFLLFSCEDRCNLTTIPIDDHTNPCSCMFDCEINGGCCQDFNKFCIETKSSITLDERNVSAINYSEKYFPTEIPTLKQLNLSEFTTSIGLNENQMNESSLQTDITANESFTTEIFETSKNNKTSSINKIQSNVSIETTTTNVNFTILSADISTEIPFLKTSFTTMKNLNISTTDKSVVTSNKLISDLSSILPVNQSVTTEIFVKAKQHTVDVLHNSSEQINEINNRLPPTKAYNTSLSSLVTSSISPNISLKSKSQNTIEFKNTTTKPIKTWKISPTDRAVIGSTTTTTNYTINQTIIIKSTKSWLQTFSNSGIYNNQGKFKYIFDKGIQIGKSVDAKELSTKNTNPLIVKTTTSSIVKTILTHQQQTNTKVTAFSTNNSESHNILTTFLSLITTLTVFIFILSIIKIYNRKFFQQKLSEDSEMHYLTASESR